MFISGNFKLLKKYIEINFYVNAIFFKINEL